VTFESTEGTWGSTEAGIEKLKQPKSKTLAILYANHKKKPNLTLSILQAR
jgi:hypothetical protein